MATDPGQHRTDLPSAAAAARAAGITSINVLAFRDTEDLAAGGSEIHADRVLSRWAGAGLDIHARTVTAPGLAETTERNGYHVTRRGGRRLGVPRIALEAATRRLPAADAVVEVWNGVPFWTPLWWRGPRLVLLHHLHDKLWDAFFPAPFDRLGSLVERRVAPWAYRRSPVVTLAPSSRDEIVARTPLRSSQVHVVAPGVDDVFRTDDLTIERSRTPLVVAAGRLTSAKRFRVLIDAVAGLVPEIPDIELVIIGEGPERSALEARIAGHGIGDRVHLVGRVSQPALVEHYRRAWVIASASVSEGWGMTLTEAASLGTPAVAADIVGHRDAVAAGAGLLVDSEYGFESGLRKLLTDAELRTQLSTEARRARELSWDATAAAILHLLVDDARRR